ncbi:fungal-specific transcription factor domain-containing protein [Aspergillus germanicus]
MTSTPVNSRKRKLPSTKSNHQACLACKGRKIACDGARPSCSFCSVRGIDCVVPPPYKRPKCSQEWGFPQSMAERVLIFIRSSHVESLEARIRALEHELQRSRSKHNSKPGNAPVGTLRQDVPLANNAFPVPQESDLDGLDGSTGLFNSLAGNTLGETLNRTTNEAADDENPDDLTDTPATDGMVPYTSGSPIDHGEDHSFTLSASFSFAANIRAATLMTGKVQISGTDPSKYIQRRKGFRVSLDSHTNEDEIALRVHKDFGQLYSLPDRHVAVALLDQFFRIVYPATPYVLEGETRHRFELLWTSDKHPNLPWIAHINMILALSCQFSENRADRDMLLGDSRSAGETFYRRARGYIVSNSSRRTSVAMLQLMLLEINYYQGTGQADECWLTIGLAVRMAQALGLHRKLPENSTLPPMTQSLYKRLWWGCYYLDRVSSMVYGLPMGIPPLRLRDNEGTIPSPAEGGSISSNPSPHTLFHYTIRLYIIMDEVWSELRQISLDNQFNDNETLTILSAIAGFDKRLLQWHQTLSAPLNFLINENDDIENGPKWAQSQKIMLKLRFLAMRINLHRQSLIFLLRSESRDRTQNSTSPPWPPIFSDVGSVPIDGLTQCTSPEGQIHAHAEHSLAQISAGICSSSAQMLIHLIERYRQRQLTGSWWWNLHFIFNSLCVMCAGMSLREPHFSRVVSDPQASKLAIRRAFKVLRTMSSQWGEQVLQSNRFLLSLLKTMLRTRGQDLEDIFTDEPHDQTTADCPTYVNNQDQDETLHVSRSTIPLNFPTWQDTLHLDPSRALPSQLFSFEDVAGVPIFQFEGSSGEVSTDGIRPELAPGPTILDDSGDIHFSPALDHDPVWLL